MESKIVDSRRLFPLNNLSLGSGPIVYWMSREQRVKDNWSLIYAQEIASNCQRPLMVIFALVDNFLGATKRQYSFMLGGLKEVEGDLRKLNIPFHVLIGEPTETIVNFAKKNSAGAVITDFDPLRIKKNWQEKIARELSCIFYEVDSHNIVPCRVASGKLEFGAYTLRPKIKRVLAEYLLPYPRLKKHPNTNLPPLIDWGKIHKKLNVDLSVSEVSWCQPGNLAAQKELKRFIKLRLENYSEERNNPNKDATSSLSPYLHFGHISSQSVALEVKKAGQKGESAASFLEELIIRKELSDNYCFYNKNYDKVEGFPDWAKKTIAEHVSDKRDYVYSLTELEKGSTHDNLWNAAQQEMVKTGKMHGYLRMYWAKKILEWTKSAQDALKISIYLNDKYQLDGRDPNGYTGIAWSIGGVHDRAWFERPIFGKIRFMSYSGCRSKFDIEKYIKRIADNF